MSQSSFVSQTVRLGRMWKSPAILLAAAGLYLGMTASALGQTVSINTGSLGAFANATNSAAVTFGPGAVTAGNDQAAIYNGTAATTTTLPYTAALNPVSTAPFTIEFWARPTASDNDDSPVSNRNAAGNRSGWVFFQRTAATGWNFRMYNGVGSGLGWDLTGGTSTLNQLNHVVATWNGSAATLYVNGVVADTTNDPAATGVYNASTTASLILGSNDTGSPYTGAVDETAIYPSALTPAQILNHFNMAASGTAGEYYTLVQSDGALLQLSNAVPEPGMLMLSAAVGTLWFGRRLTRTSR